MKRCSHRGCNRPAPMLIGWGIHGLNQAWCVEHYIGALVRLAGLLRCVGMVA